MSIWKEFKKGEQQMSEFRKEFKNFMDDLEKNIKNKEDLEYVRGRTADFLNVVLEQMENIINFKEEKINQMETMQQELDQKMNKIQQTIDNIEQDIYSEDGFDFEIVCPYCNYEFFIDVDSEKSEIECPECKNIIELDWTGGEEPEDSQNCAGHCSHCNGCDEPEDDDM